MRHLSPFALALLLAAPLGAVQVSVDPVYAGCGTAELVDEANGGNGRSTVSLRAEAAEGYAFAGWIVDGRAPDWPVDARRPEIAALELPSDAVVQAAFIGREEDGLEFDIAEDLAQFVYGESVDVPLLVNSYSYPTLSFTGLPPGLKFDPGTLRVSGRTAAAGVFQVRAAGVNASGFRFTQYFDIQVGNRSVNGLEGQDVRVPLGEYCVFDFSQIETGSEARDGWLFNCPQPRRSAKLADIPPGMTWDEGWGILYGTPTKAGDYTVSATVVYANGVSAAATARFSVVPPDPRAYDVDVDVLAGLSVGDELDAETYELGTFADGVGLVSVTGLPAGLSVETTTDADGVRHLGVAGRVRTAGRYMVVATVAHRSFEVVETVVAQTEVVVADTMMTYLHVGYLDEDGSGRGSVSGGGPVSVGQAVTVRAVPKTGYVFAGWHDTDGEALDLEEGSDYRMPTLTFSAGTDFSFYRVFGRFLAKAEDEIAIGSEIVDANFEFDCEEVLDETFSVVSGSLPTLSFKGLPAGVEVLPNGDGRFALWYDGETARSRPAPGRYAVTLTAVNASGARDTTSFSVTVANWRDARVDIEDDYGTFTPGEAIEPISLDMAVDFEAGETLSVSGLPKGLVYNKTANARTGVDAHTVTGTPTVPGDYTVVFTAKVVTGETVDRAGRVQRIFETVTVTASFAVLPWPALEVALDGTAEDAGCTVTGTGAYRPGTKVTLKAKPAAGWVFAGWSGADDLSELAAKSPSLSLVTGEDGLFLDAEFIPVSEDFLFIGNPAPATDAFAAVLDTGIDVAELEVANLVADLIDTGSYPTVSISGLPTGIKFDKATFRLSGVPKKPGVHYVTVSAKNAGGYTFVRVLRIGVAGDDGALPDEAPLQDEVGVDGKPFEGLTTGVFYGEGDVSLAVPAQPGTGSPVKRVALTGLPAGLSAATTLLDGVARVALTGTPTKPGRMSTLVAVTYANGKSAKTRCAYNVEDGGSYYLFVDSADEARGRATGMGVYASGATVKLKATAAKGHAFAGWLQADGTLFGPLADTDGVDPRTSAASFPFRPEDFASDLSLTAAFVPSADDAAPEIELESPVWAVTNGVASALGCTAASASLPKWTVKGLPKGLVFDAARGRLSYDGRSAVTPGIYAVTLSAVNQSRAVAAPATLEIRVANLVSDEIAGVSPEMDAYQLMVGVQVPVDAILPAVGEGWSLSVKGLPQGMSFKNGVVSGVPAKAGDYTVTLVATTGTGRDRRTETATITLRVQTAPASLAGTFNGYLLDPARPDDITGTFMATVTSAGKISAKVTTAAGTFAFSAPAWDAVDAAGAASVSMTDKDGRKLTISVDSSMDWQSWQLSGTFQDGVADGLVRAQRNPLGAKDGVEEARASAARVAGTYLVDGLQFQVQKGGAVKVAGRVDGVSVSGTTVLVYDAGWQVRFWKWVKGVGPCLKQFALDEE